jgi:hypothetical protein
MAIIIVSKKNDFLIIAILLSVVYLKVRLLINYPLL